LRRANPFQPVEVLFVCEFPSRENASQEVRSFEALIPIEARLISVRRQGNGEPEFGFDGVIDDDLRVRDDLAENAFVRVAGAIGPVHVEDPVPARFEVEGFKSAGETIRAPPLGEFLRVFKGGEDSCRRKRQ